MKKIFALGVAILAFAACNMDFYPSDSMTSSQLKDNPSSAVYTTDGVYALFKDNLPYKGESSGDGGNMYVRHLFQLAETRGDNVTISGHSIDPFTGPYRYEDVDNTKNKYYLWWMAYKIIYAANSNIAGLEGLNDAASLHLLGENYFFRAIAHFHLVQLFAMPYVCGRNNPGVVLRIGMSSYDDTKRASVGECYDAVVADLKKAYEYMDKGTPRGDGSYVSAKAARALLSRVYLNMGDEHLDDCIALCNDLIDGNPDKNLQACPASVKGVYSVETLSTYPTQTWSSPETIWCIHHIYPNDLVSEEATIGAMYFATGDLSETAEAEAHVGWGQWFWSDELIELFKRYDDNRFKAYFYPVGLKTFAPGDPVTKTICFPEKGPDGTDFCTTGFVTGVPESSGDYSFTYEGTNYVAKKTVMPGGYIRYFVDHNFTGDATYFDGKTPVYVRDDLQVEVDPATGEKTVIGVRSNNYVRYFNTKFSGQDGQVTFSSPVILRWGEVFLNRAEAYARKNMPAQAFIDVNTVRTRAGLPAEAMFSVDEMHGYTSALDVVLDERRMELCFEGDRMFSVFRNKKSLDRRYVGYHPWAIISYDNPKIALLIPATETGSTPGFEQNDR
ncbi:MAG: RagB/SusD family nutrient uptake outer membrane protein [Bacteroidales bacterium]|nr:RagB/SusD family nutrient uptake outer membrane protein [Bacteroidales bacterium]